MSVLCASIPVTGSSSMRTRGSAASAFAMNARCIWPPDSSPIRLSASSCIHMSCSMRSTLSRLSAPPRRLPRRGHQPRPPPVTPSPTISLTVAGKFLSKDGLCSTYPTLRRYEGESRMSRPKNRMVPSYPRIRPSMHANSVVLPAPLGPMTPTRSPSPTERLTPSIAGGAPSYPAERHDTSTAFIDTGRQQGRLGSCASFRCRTGRLGGPAPALRSA